MVRSNDENRPASLLITHDEAERALQRQIDLGDELLARARGISNEGQLDEVRRAYSQWSGYNSEFIKRNFSDDSYLREYEGIVSSTPSGRIKIRDLQQYIREKVDRLESLLGRLALIPSSASASDNESASLVSASLGNSVFIVHGHDDGAKQAVARMVERLGLDAIILDEQPQDGRTIIEKFEEHAGEVGFAIVLLTPDDVGAKAGDEENLKPRARQNVIFELGFFVGKLGRERVCPLYKQGVEIPSDYDGVGYVEMGESDGWQLSVARELRSARLPVDLNDLL